MGAIFIPLIVFMFRLVIDINVMKQKINELCNSSKDSKDEIHNLSEITNQIDVIKVRLDNVEKLCPNPKGSPL